MSSPALDEALTTAPWVADDRRPTAIELVDWLMFQCPSIRVGYLACLLQSIEDARRDALLEVADQRDEMAEAWGRGASWFTTGNKVADLVSGWLRETAEEIE